MCSAEPFRGNACRTADLDSSDQSGSVVDGWTDLQDDVAQQSQVAVPHGTGPDQNLRVVAVVPLVIHRQDDSAQRRVVFTGCGPVLLQSRTDLLNRD